LRQFVILLPLFFNDGSRVPAELFLQTYEELIDQFGGLSVDEVEVSGYWRHEGVRYEDVLKRLTVVAADLPEHDAFIRRFKERLKERFDQIEIWITAQRIDVI
jgi:hypothetical protein